MNSQRGASQGQHCWGEVWSWCQTLGLPPAPGGSSHTLMQSSGDSPSLSVWWAWSQNHLKELGQGCQVQQRGRDEHVSAASQRSLALYSQCPAQFLSHKKPASSFHPFSLWLSPASFQNRIWVMWKKLRTQDKDLVVAEIGREKNKGKTDDETKTYVGTLKGQEVLVVIFHSLS